MALSLVFSTKVAPKAVFLCLKSNNKLQAMADKLNLQGLQDSLQIVSSRRSFRFLVRLDSLIEFLVHLKVHIYTVLASNTC